MKMEKKRACPACDNMFSGTMEFCPVCMLRKGLEVHVEPGESTSQVAFALDFCSLFRRDHIDFHPRSPGHLRGIFFQHDKSDHQNRASEARCSCQSPLKKEALR
jgi:hypothetical protein